MDMSPACSPPIQPHVSASEQLHPRYRDYLNYRAAMNRQMVTGCSFALWLEGTERNENGAEYVYHIAAGEYPQTCLRGRMAPGWYKDKQAPRTGKLTTFGPFDEKYDAEAA
jgi:hypothetical protein